jgi:hypothetical protein
MLKRKQLIWIGSVTLVLLLIAGYALSQPPGAPAAPGMPGAGGAPGMPGAGPGAAGAPAGGPPGAAGAGGAGAKDASAAQALSQSTPDEEKAGLKAVLAMIAAGKVGGRLSTPCNPGQACAAYGGVKTPMPVAVWAPPVIEDPKNLPTVYVPDAKEAAIMKKYYDMRYATTPNTWAERQKDFDLQIAQELDNQTKGQKPYAEAVAPPIVPPSTSAPAPAAGGGGAPGGAPGGMPPGAMPPGALPPGAGPAAPPGPTPPPAPK